MAAGNEAKPPTPEEIQSGISSQVIGFIIGMVIVILIAILVLVSKMFRVYIALWRLEVYKSNEITLRSISDVSSYYKKDKLLKDFYIASAYRPYVCYYHKYDYVSVEVFKEILSAGPRMVELEVFNDSFGDKVEPVVSIGDEKGEWRYTLNSVHLKEFLRAIARVAFNPVTCKVHKDPFILFLNLKTNRNIKCLNKIHRYIYDELGQFLLPPNYSYNDKNDKFTNITLGSCIGKVIIMASTGFEGTNLEELINYSTVSNYTIKYKKNQRRVLYLYQDDIVESEEDIEDYVNPEHHKVSKTQVLEYNKCSFTILSPAKKNPSLLSGISPLNYEPGKGLEAGCQFIMMNYQKINGPMSNYLYVFKDTSLVEKVDTKVTCRSKIFEGLKEEKVNLNKSELNYLYASTK
jgi:hypothetical protein